MSLGAIEHVAHELDARVRVLGDARAAAADATGHVAVDRQEEREEDDACVSNWGGGGLCVCLCVCR